MAIKDDIVITPGESGSSVVGNSVFDSAYVIYKNTSGLTANINNNINDMLKYAKIPLTTNFSGAFTFNSLDKTLTWSGAELVLIPSDDYCTYLKVKNNNNSNTRYFYRSNDGFYLGTSGTIPVLEFGFGMEKDKTYLRYSFPVLDRTNYDLVNDTNNDEKRTVENDVNKITSYRYRIDSNRIFGNEQKSKININNKYRYLNTSKINEQPMYFGLQPEYSKTILYSNWVEHSDINNIYIYVDSDDNLYIDGVCKRKIYWDGNNVESPVYVLIQDFSWEHDRGQCKSYAHSVYPYDKDLNAEETFAHFFLVHENVMSDEFTKGNPSMTWFGPQRTWDSNLNICGSVRIFDATNVLRALKEREQSISLSDFESEVISDNKEIKSTEYQYLMQTFCTQITSKETLNLITKGSFDDLEWYSNYNSFMAGTRNTQKYTKDNSEYLVRSWGASDKEYKMDNAAFTLIANAHWGTVTVDNEFYILNTQTAPQLITVDSKDFLFNYLAYDIQSSGHNYISDYGPSKFGQLDLWDYINYFGYQNNFSSYYINCYLTDQDTQHTWYNEYVTDLDNFYYGIYYQDLYDYAFLQGPESLKIDATYDGRGHGIWGWGAYVRKTRNFDLISIVMI